MDPKNSDHESKNFQAHRERDGFGFLPGPYDLNADGVTREAMCLKNFGHGWRPLSAGDDIEMAAKVRFHRLLVQSWKQIISFKIVGRALCLDFGKSRGIRPVRFPGWTK